MFQQLCRDRVLLILRKFLAAWFMQAESVADYALHLRTIFRLSRFDAISDPWLIHT